MTEWSPQQADALAKVAAWHKAGNDQVMRVFGYAGTGKTTLARHFASQIEGETAFAAYTGKAAVVMNKSGCKEASTIHSLIYETEQHEESGEITFHLDTLGAAKDAELIVIDECSMVDEEIGKDLLSFGTPILVLGDPAQLPPVKGGGYFTSQEPEVMLTEIHRQAEGNPIVKLATDVRQGKRLELGQYGNSKVISKMDITAEQVTAADQVLVGTNKSRHLYNGRMRTLNGFDDPLPVIGDRLVCLKNDRGLKIFNGGLFEVVKVKLPGAYPECVKLVVRSEDFPGREAFDVLIRQEFFTGGAEQIPWQDLRGQQHFNYGYALTVHKSQGSQWDNVVLFDESRAFRDDWQRWLYTGITRAAETITVVR